MNDDTNKNAPGSTAAELVRALADSIGADHFTISPQSPGDWCSHKYKITAYYPNNVTIIKTLLTGPEHIPSLRSAVVQAMLKSIHEEYEELLKEPK